MAPAEPRVLFVSSHSSDGGSERHLHRLLRRFGAATVAGIVCLQDGPLVRRLRDEGWEVDVLPTGADPLALARTGHRLRRVLGARAPDVVHANGVKAAIAVLLARPRAPVVWNKHDHAFDGPIGGAVARRCAAVVAVSASAGRAVAGSARRLVVLPPLVELPAADAAAGRARLSELTSGAPGAVVVVVGRLEKAKGQLDVVEALPALRATAGDVHVVLVGGDQPAEPDHARVVTERAAALGVGDAVHLAGFRDDAVDLVAGADVLVVASHPVNRRGMGAEGYGLVAVEALAVGTPVVAYAAGALPEVLGDCGLLVTVGDRAGLAAAVHDLLTHSDATAQLVACGRQRVQPVLTGTATVDGLLEVYRLVSAAPSR